MPRVASDFRVTTDGRRRLELIIFCPPFLEEQDSGQKNRKAQLQEARNISDTARWAAYVRPEETKRPTRSSASNRHAWAWVTRTYSFDLFITQELQQGVGLALNLAAGLYARPYSHEAGFIVARDRSRPAGNPRLQRRNPSKRKTHLRARTRPPGFGRRRRAASAEGMLKTATKFKHPPLFLRLPGHLPEKKRPAGKQPWSGVCLLRQSN